MAMFPHMPMGQLKDPTATGKDTHISHLFYKGGTTLSPLNQTTGSLLTCHNRRPQYSLKIASTFCSDYTSNVWLFATIYSGQLSGKNSSLFRPQFPVTYMVYKFRDMDNFVFSGTIHVL